MGGSGASSAPSAGRLVGDYRKRAAKLDAEWRAVNATGDKAALEVVQAKRNALYETAPHALLRGPATTKAARYDQAADLHQAAYRAYRAADKALTDEQATYNRPAVVKRLRARRDRTWAGVKRRQASLDAFAR
jgi:hypothetical protein